MKVSIITVCYNSEKTIKDTLESVLNQTYKNYEYLIIDGKSKDNTLKIVEEYIPKFKGKLKIVSEKDNGLYDAMNKGIKKATGDIIGIINSDDILANRYVFETIIKSFEKNKCDGIYSNLNFLDEKTMSKVERKFIAGSGNYKLGWHPPHPTLYLKKEVFDKFGYYNQKYRIAADYDFMLRIMKSNTLKLEYINETLVNMRTGGVSTNGIKGYYKSFKESYQVLKNNKIKFALVINIIRTLKIFLQVLKAKFK